MIEVDQELAELMSAVFVEHRRKRSTAPDRTTVPTWDLALWEQLDEVGLARLTGSEASGGSGATWFAAAELLDAAARFGVPTPVVEHDLLAGWLLDEAALPVDDARRSACVTDEHGIARGVGWASGAEKLVVAWPHAGGHRVADVDIADVDVTAGVNMAGEPRDVVAVAVDRLAGVDVPPGVIDRFGLRGALARAVQSCGALDGAVALSVSHACAREQFGRPLARFQAVAALVADAAAEAALARAATEAALAAAVHSEWSAPNLAFLIAVARSCAGRATSTVVRNAHQVHGAIGTTQEHGLHEFTLPALAWCSEFGSVHAWEQRITDAAVDAGADGLWPLIVG